MGAETPAIASLEGSGLTFTVVRTEPANSVEESAAMQHIEVGSLLRTILLRRGENDYLFVLVPGGRQIDWPKLRAHLGVRRVSLPDVEEAKRVTGYERGAITPFGVEREIPVLADESVVGLGRVAIGGGARGVNLHVDAAELVVHLGADVADIT